MSLRKFFCAIWKIDQYLILAKLKTKGVSVGDKVIFYGSPNIALHKNSVISIGDRVVLCSDDRFTALALNHKVKLSTICERAQIHIGKDTGMSGTCIICATSVDVGSEVLIGANVMIVDTDFHPITPLGRRHSDDKSKIRTSAVFIGDNVFIGAEVVILKGVKVLKDSVIAAGSVVISGDYPEGAILAGNPARVVGSVYNNI
jgi:serine acetyltransferase